MDAIKVLTLCFLAFLGAFSVQGFKLADFNEKPMMESAYNFLRGKGQLLVEVVESTEGAEFLLDEELYPEFFELIDILDDDDNSTNNDTSPVCNSCRAIAASLKALAAASESWGGVREVVVDLCYNLFENLTDVYIRADVLCPGVVDVQGPHVYEVLLPRNGASPEDICRNQNACLPPPDDSRVNTVKRTKSVKKQYKPGSKKTLAERKKEAMTVVQLADIHIEPRYQARTETDCGLPVCCIPLYGEGSAGYYGDYTCNVPEPVMELFLRKTAEFQPEFVIYTGDTPPHAMWDETYDSQLDCTERLVAAMTRVFDGAYNVYPAIGNHEMYPTNVYSMEYIANYTGEMTREFASLWTDLAGFSEENIASFEAGAYYTTVVRPGLRILTFNTNYWYSFNWYSVLHEGGEEIQAMFDFMRDSLEEARVNNEKVIIIGHHPPNSGDALVLPTRELEALVDEYSDLIIMQVAGHTHSDEFRVHSLDGIPLSVVWVSPTAEARGKDPSMRVFYIDSETYEVIDFEKYGFKLADTIDNPEEPVIEFQYSAMEEYGLADMSPASWRDLIDRMATDDALLQTYYKNYRSSTTNDTCDEGCRINHVCRSQFYSYDDRVYCIEDATQSL